MFVIIFIVTVSVSVLDMLTIVSMAGLLNNANKFYDTRTESKLMTNWTYGFGIVFVIISELFAI